MAAHVLRGGHGLLLHCIHARQAPDALLIQLDRAAMFGRVSGRLALFGQFSLKARKKARLQLIWRRLCHLSAHQDNRHLARPDHCGGGGADNQTADARMAVSPHHQHIETGLIDQFAQGGFGLTRQD